MNIETCAVCASQRVIISRNVVDDDATETFTVSCGRPGCLHNVSARTELDAIAEWNRLSTASDGEHDPATEVVRY